MENKGHGPLAGVRVLDLTRVLSGPFCTMYLGDMGAEIIKIENPNGGDDTRSWSPMVNGSSLYFAQCNRNKRSITLNLKSEEGKRIFLDLVKTADVVVENFRTDVMKKLGLGYDVLREVNPGIIYGSVSGFGSEGPYATLGGYDVVAQAMSGIMSLTGPGDGKAYKCGVAIGDISGGLNLAIGIAAALYNRTQTGKGQYVETSMVNCLLAMETGDVNQYFVDGKDLHRIGNLNSTMAPFGAFEAADQDFVLCCGNDKLFGKLCTEVMHRPEILLDERYKTAVARKKNELEVRDLVENWSKQRSAAENVRVLSEHGIPASEILSIDQIRHDPHIAGAQGMFEEFDHPEIGHSEMIANPIKFSETKVCTRRVAPLLGEHTEEVLHELLGLDKTRLEELHNAGAI